LKKNSFDRLSEIERGEKKRETIVLFHSPGWARRKMPRPKQKTDSWQEKRRGSRPISAEEKRKGAQAHAEKRKAGSMRSIYMTDGQHVAEGGGGSAYVIGEGKSQLSKKGKGNLPIAAHQNTPPT